MFVLLFEQSQIYFLIAGKEFGNGRPKTTSSGHLLSNSGHTDSSKSKTEPEEAKKNSLDAVKGDGFSSLKTSLKKERG